MDLERVRAVLELIANGIGLARELAGLARRNEARTELEGHGDTDHEAARLGADDLGDARIAEMIGDVLDRAAHGLGVREQGRDVLEHDARLGIVGNVGDVGLVIEACHGVRFLLCVQG